MPTSRYALLLSFLALPVLSAPNPDPGLRFLDLDRALEEAQGIPRFSERLASFAAGRSQDRAALRAAERDIEALRRELLGLDGESQQFVEAQAEINVLAYRLDQDRRMMAARADRANRQLTLEVSSAILAAAKQLAEQEGWPTVLRYRSLGENGGSQASVYAAFQDADVLVRSEALDITAEVISILAR